MVGWGFCCVLINSSKSAPLAAQIEHGWLVQVAEATEKQLNIHFAPYYGGSFKVRAGTSAHDVQTGEIVFTIEDSYPEAPDAVAFHDVEGNDVPYAILALDTCQTLSDVSTAISHELLEVGGDPDCNKWADTGNGQEYAYEVCDPVQEASYDIDSVAVSDFVLPSYFAPSAVAPFSYLQTQAKAGPQNAFAIESGGYAIVRDSGGGETQVTGTLGKRTSRSKHEQSRTYRRLHGIIQGT
jgi:hypothetical protein